MCDYSDSDDEDLYKVSAKSKKFSTQLVKEIQKLENNVPLSATDHSPNSRKRSKDKLNAISKDISSSKPSIKPAIVDVDNEPDSQPLNDVIEVPDDPVRDVSPPPPSPPPDLRTEPKPRQEPLPVKRSRARTEANKKIIHNLDESIDEMVKVTSTVNTSVLDESNVSLAGDDSVICVDGDEGRDLMVRVRSRSGIQRFSVKTNSRLNDIFGLMARHEGVNESCVKMYLNERLLKRGETPASVGLDVAAIIECYVIRPNMDDSGDENPDMITLYVQSQTHRQKTAFKISKYDFLSKLMFQYAQQRKVPVESLIFLFDGETIQGNKTVADFDIDDGECIDVVSKD